MGGQVIYHLLTAWHVTAAPWPVVTLVSCLPVLTLGFGTALTHLLRTGHAPAPAADEPRPVLIEAAPAADEPDTAPAIRADSIPAIGDSAEADNAPAIEAAPAADTNPDSTPAPKRTTARTRRGPSTADRVTRMRDKHPDETPAQIARRLDLSTRTVRRYLPAAPAADAPQLVSA
jgi:hypothetical protein